MVDPVTTGIATAKELREQAERLRRRGERQRANAEARIAHRLAMKQQVADDLAPMMRGDVEVEVLIRDADRQPDGWPEADWKFRVRRLSPWFKVGVMRPYGGGICTVLRLDRVIVEDGVARSQESDDAEGELVRVVGHIPYESIVAIDRDGDANFSGPHVYCHFDFGTEPYEHKLLYRQHHGGVWLPWEDVEYRPKKYSHLRRYLWHRQSLKLQREAERDRQEHLADQERRG
jgi:hypothetical protein